MSEWIKLIVKEPLLHFLAIGLCLFLVYGVLNPSADNEQSNRINVDRDALLTYLQYKAKTFDNDRFNQALDKMSVAERQGLIENYVRDETLYREAKALQLDRNDNIARQRLIQQMRYLTQSVVSAGQSITEDALFAYFDENAERYLEPATTTFTHVFFSTAERSPESAEALANQQLAKLNEQQIPFHRAIGIGERFLYHRNYVRKDADLISSHFGEDMASTIFALPTNDIRWQGPYRSTYGYHLVLVTQQTSAYTPALEEIKNRVAQDLRQQHQQQQLNHAITRMVQHYEVTVTAELQASLIAGET